MQKLLVRCIALSLSPTLFAADGPIDRQCNLQAREIALRAGEEMTPALNRSQRDSLARIAAEVCADYSGLGTASMPAPAANGVYGRERAAAAQAESRPVVASRPAAEAEADMEREEADDEEGGGLFGNLRIIDSEDRVQRPGLKRR